MAGADISGVLFAPRVRHGWFTLPLLMGAPTALAQTLGTTSPAWKQNLARQYAEKDYFVVRNAISDQELADVREAIKYIEENPRASDEWLNYYERSPNGGEMLCRTENFANAHPAFSKIAMAGGKVLELAAFTLNEPVVLFKERINYKYPGGGAFPAHQDGLAWEGLADLSSSVPLGQRKLTPQKNSSFTHRMVNVNIAIDASTMENGCLEIAAGKWVDGNGSYVRMPQNDDGTITDEFQASAEWFPAELNPGDALVFGVAVPHRSGINKTPKSRKSLYLTYNAEGFGDFRDAYYRNYRENYPPSHLREAGKDYSDGFAAFSYATPIIN